MVLLSFKLHKVLYSQLLLQLVLVIQDQVPSLYVPDLTPKAHRCDLDTTISGAR